MKRFFQQPSPDREPKKLAKDASEEDDVPQKQQKKNSSLRKLGPVVRSNELLCVGGRIGRAILPREVTNPVILPKTSHVTTLIIRPRHEQTSSQQGR